ncbi:MAG: outer membrane protein assembly factor BamA [Deltaproteobacteria bacterium HGW-Deltaproteobacteria-17]|nr:MAG: outer membrane protein assembly factor BamA [Deltaproteobacteria bacterium HGW-Deltaproteobacteria-17]
MRFLHCCLFLLFFQVALCAGRTSEALATIPDLEIEGKFLESGAPILRALRQELERVSPDGDWEAVVKRRLAMLGYSLVKTEAVNGKPAPTVRLYIEPVQLVRSVFVRGNWPLFESDIMRRVILRPGSALPVDPAERAELIENQVRRIEEYLHREGYFDSKIRIQLKKLDKPHEIDVVVHLNKGSSYRLGQLDIRGNDSISADTIDGFFRHRILFYNKPFYLQQFKKDIKTLIQYYRRQGFFAVSVKHDFHKSYSLNREERTVNIGLYIRERRKVEVKFKGNLQLHENQLREQLTFVESGSYDEHEIVRSAKALAHFYHTMGYFNATVFSESHIIGDSALRVNFYIQEGLQYRVEKILFEGNKHFSASRLRSEISTKPFPKKLSVIGLGSGGFITPTQLAQDEERIREAYKKAGFPDVEVSSRVITAGDDVEAVLKSTLEAALPYRKGHQYVYVQFTVKENHRVLLARVRFLGADRDEAALKRLQTARTGQPFSMDRIQSDLLEFKRHFSNRGFPYCTITTEIKASADQKNVDVTYLIDRKQPVRIGPVFIRGNFKTRQSVIRREIPFSEQDPFSFSKIEEAGRNLRSLGVFRSVRIQFLGLEEQLSEIPVIVTVIERFDDYGSMEVGGGFSTDNLYFTSFSYQNRNLFGLAKSLELRGEVGAEIQSGRATYQDPRFLGTDLIFEISAFGRTEATVRLGDIITYGSSVTLRKRWSQRLQWFMRYEIRRVSYKETLIRVSGAPEEDSSVDFTTTTASIGPTIIVDHRDNPLVPKKGYRLTSSVRLASNYLGGDDNFIHFNTTGQLFLPLPLGMILAQGLRYDHGLPFSGTQALPKVERFFAGGDTTVRGYEEDLLFTQMLRTPMHPTGSGELFKVSPLGGNIRFISNTELQFPIWKSSFILGMPIWGALFFDSGYIINHYDTFSQELFHSGYGAALRLVTPVGVISLEYAIPITRVWGNESDGRIHFNFGFIF